MAIILDHPDKDYDPLIDTFEFEEGLITIKSTSSEPLSFYDRLGLLEAAKAVLLKAWLD